MKKIYLFSGKRGRIAEVKKILEVIKGDHLNHWLSSEIGMKSDITITYDQGRIQDDGSFILDPG